MKPGESHKGSDSLCRNGVRQKQTKLGKKGEDGMDWFTGLMQFGGMSGAQGEICPSLLPTFAQ